MFFFISFCYIQLKISILSIVKKWGRFKEIVQATRKGKKLLPHISRFLRSKFILDQYNNLTACT